MPDWLDYRKLAASIYADFEKNAVVVHNDKVRGIDSGIYRQIDVSNSFTFNREEIGVEDGS
jgi:hypothetical protein